MSQLRIAQLSDSHFGTILPGVKEGLLETLKELNPDLILLTGDITQRATAAQFKEAHAFVDFLKPIPTICVPGNHDIPLLNIFVRLFDPYRGFKKFFKYRTEKDYVHEDIVITGLNSTSRWRHVQGSLNLARTEKRLHEKINRAKVHIVAFHHPVDCSKPQDEKNLLKNRNEVMNLLSQNEVDLVVGGHIHDPFTTLSAGRYPEAKRQIIISVAGTCLSWRTRKKAPNSFNLIEVDTNDTPKLSVTRFDQQADKKFVKKSTHSFTRSPVNGWEAL